MESTTLPPVMELGSSNVTGSPIIASDLQFLANVTSNTSGYSNGTGFNQPTLGPEQCAVIHNSIKFDHLQIVRVTITWILFLISSVGNIFVLSCVYRKAKTSHVHMIMMHFAIADLTFTFLVMPNDAIWNTTMQWTVGPFFCKLCQMLKQIGMYISSFMVVVIALDRCFSILLPMSTPTSQRIRTKCLVGGAWTLSILSAIPSAVLFSLKTFNLCNIVFDQCVDFVVVPDISQRRHYLFFSMFMTFILPLIFTIISYSLVILEISNMVKRDRQMMGRRESCNNITRARKKTLIMTIMVTTSFLLLWGPYFTFALFDWFQKQAHANLVPKEVSMTLFLLMYIHPAIHPFLYGVFMKDVRVRFRKTIAAIQKILSCNNSEKTIASGANGVSLMDKGAYSRLGYGEKTMKCLSSKKKSPVSNSNGYAKHEYNAIKHEVTSNRSEPVVQDIPRNESGSEQDRLVAADIVELNSHGDPIQDSIQGRTVLFSASRLSDSRLSDSMADNNGLVTNNNKQEEFIKVEEPISNEVFKSSSV